MKYGGNRPKFALNWLTEIGHEWLNQIAIADDDLANLFTELHPYLKVKVDTKSKKSSKWHAYLDFLAYESKIRLNT